jgi:hypothetical protein
MFVQFELLEEVKTGKRVDTFFGTKEEVKNEWVPYRNVKVISGSGALDSLLLVMMPDGEPAWLDLFSSPENEDFIREAAFTRGEDKDWQDIKYFEFYV